LLEANQESPPWRTVRSSGRESLSRFPEARFAMLRPLETIFLDGIQGVKSLDQPPREPPSPADLARALLEAAATSREARRWGVWYAIE